MAYIAHDVYKDGIDKTILDSEKKIFLALISAEFESNTDGVKLFDGTKVLAISELRSGTGTINNNDSSDLKIDEVATKVNSLGKFEKKVLTILPIPYNRTASVLSNSGVATHFALICYKAPGVAHKAYEVDTDEIDPATGLPKTQEVYFNAPGDLDTTDNFEVYLIGALSSNPTINANSNFMFGGASITFKEA